MTASASVKAKKEVRATATIDLGQYDDKRSDGTKVKKTAYLTVYADELSTMGVASVKVAELQAVKITKGKLKGRTIYRPIDDTSASGRHFQLQYLIKGATGKGRKRVPAVFDTIQAYFPTWMSTRQIFAAISKFKKLPKFVITDLGTSVKTDLSNRSNG